MSHGPDDTPVSALVVLRPAGGRIVSGRDQITQENVETFLPEPEATSRVIAFFHGAGFEVSEAAGVSVSITGATSLFERTFGERLQIDGEPQVTSARSARGSLELSLDRIPPDVVAGIQAVTFTPPPDFGPTGYA